jgi:hypothetical protein
VDLASDATAATFRQVKSPEAGRRASTNTAPTTVVPGAHGSAYALLRDAQADIAAGMPTVASSHQMQYAAEVANSAKTTVSAIFDDSEGRA